jgi:hypothetical protein
MVSIAVIVLGVFVLRVRVLDYPGATKVYDGDLAKLSSTVIPNIANSFELETGLPWIADVEIHKALAVGRGVDGFKLIYSSGFHYGFDGELGVYVPTIDLYAPKILTYDFRWLKGLLYHEYLVYLHQCFHGLDWKPKILWNPGKRGAKIYYDVYLDLERALEMALRCFRGDEALMGFLDVEVDIFLSVLSGSVKPRVVEGFPELDVGVGEDVLDPSKPPVALTIRPRILLDRIYTGEDLPDLKEKLSSRGVLLEKYLILSGMFREKAF